MPPKVSRPVAVITVLLPVHTVAGDALATAATGIPVQGVSRRTLSRPISVVPRSEVARKRITVVGEVLVRVYSRSVHVAAWASVASGVKLLPPSVETPTSSTSDPFPLIWAKRSLVLPVAALMSTYRSKVPVWPILASTEWKRADREPDEEAGVYMPAEEIQPALAP